MICDTVKLFLEKYNLLKPKNNIIVAFSGGYDSMCLLHIMKKISSDYDLNLIAVHLNHNWRGKESDNEEDICKSFCKDITFYSEKLSSDIPHTETAAREARYKFFEECAKKFNSKVVLTAHNANDNAETVFYRIMKGTGITGLEGIAENRGIYYRPLLSVYRNEIENYCNENDLKPNNDSSNSDVKYERNRIRKEIFPLFPDIEYRLNNLIESAKSANLIINKKLKKLEDYKTKDFCNLSSTVQSFAVHKFFRDNSLDYDKKKIDRITTFINNNKYSKSGKTHSLTDNLWLFVNSEKIELVKKSPVLSNELHIEGEGLYKYNNSTLTVEKVDKIPSEYPSDSEFEAFVNINKIDFVLRTRRDGDIIYPLGLQGKQKLKKYLNSKKIPKHERDNILLLTRGNEVFWAAGIGLSDKLKVISSPVYRLKITR